jgi:hypothetical protein
MILEKRGKLALCGGRIGKERPRVVGRRTDGDIAPSGKIMRMGVAWTSQTLPQ